MINVHLSKNEAGDFDIVWEDGKIKLAEDGTAAAVAMTERVLLFRNECEDSPIVDTNVDPLAGVDWYGIIFQTSKSKAEKELELKRVIRSAPGIDDIVIWQWSQTNRTVSITCHVNTQWGVLDASQELSPL